jgi:hypothetical protein
MPLRRAGICALLLALSAVLAVLLHVYYAGGFEHLPPRLRIATLCRSRGALDD